ncbi:lysozyme [Melghirimyces profundicolus]|uniref:Lysozyme n=1 Tax=Melghirimyces profundicolus TaxID=1242148 RepID=A0A2T6BG40_9BACL|nr:GH25 family lysozyme [Melghirimyces profundicolus]PTX55016.1 lysozyme [Melghirimyces profundicolus]
MAQRPVCQRYKVKGLDVSHHQGKIDWQQVKEADRIYFVYLKATEGHDFVDHRFISNWKEAKAAGFDVGAYHFFSMRSSGERQAQNFIRTVPKEADSLPPVIDVEVHLNHDPVKVRRELRRLASELKAHYDKRPMLYVTYDTYERYIKGHFQESDLWIRDIYTPPTLSKGQWILWQYHNRDRMKGVNTSVDMNAFNGDMVAYKRWVKGGASE